MTLAQRTERSEGMLCSSLGRHPRLRYQQVQRPEGRSGLSMLIDMEESPLDGAE